ncbi:MAG TPA: integrase core domain-containing protein, partial [Terriglobales bacterium]|nr:integrase core domain-containing protein [Terriglobales bacterium]
VKLGFVLSERTVSRWLRRAPKKPDTGRLWKAFLNNHREVITAMDFFTVPTLSFSVLYCFFVIAHDRRRILHFNVTKHPSSFWIAQQLRESFPAPHSHKFLIFDGDAKFGNEVLSATAAVELISARTSFPGLWQNGVAERWVGSCRRDLLDHVLALNVRHLKRLLAEYVRYYHDDRTHLGLQKETPGQRKTADRVGSCRVISIPRLGGLHHRYDLAA